MEKKLGTIAFYNVENFYAKTVEDDPSFLPSNFTKWVDNRYAIKVKNIAQALTQIGRKETGEAPIFVGLAEVENDSVLEDLICHPYLKEANYSYLLYESLDERKINVACLYNKDKIKILSSEPLRIVFKDSAGITSYTRDVLYVKANLEEHLVHLFVVHLPSKLDQEINQQKRKLILENLRNRITQILKEDATAQIILMGDFNDTPTADNIRLCLDTRANMNEMTMNSLYNPMVALMSYKRGSLVHRKQWMLFDQLLFSNSFLTKNKAIEHQKTDIFDASFLTTNTGKLGAFPHRTFVGSKYLGGYSDHFPVYTIIKY